ncbi:KH domain protein [Oesophagostomum dentatum]|uniref:KH domain protein n=1 Tax=Oesophagostomum dentatum TaxID=61180 RepID=A0A0B1T3Y3_OESDE|nr:KH domain protein [Oesophagostomum dentatum]
MWQIRRFMFFSLKVHSEQEPVMPAQQMAFLPQNPLFIPPETPPATHPNAGFYLIPASGGWMPPILPGMPPNPFVPQPLINPEAVLMRQRSLKKPNQTKSMQLRHEMIIRNSDSGKIMGVKGRRVALVEQMTNTVISFQKVDSKCKERTLTITASSMEDIERAKDLIIETIKRNMSPTRPDAAVHEEPDEDEENENDISIETTQDGMLKLCCSDPQVLQAAQEALSQYLRARAKPSAEEREKRKERRKSMPLQASHPEPPPKNVSKISSKIRLVLFIHM